MCAPWLTPCMHTAWPQNCAAVSTWAMMPAATLFSNSGCVRGSYQAPRVACVGCHAVCCCCYASRRGLLGWAIMALMPCSPGHRQASTRSLYANPVSCKKPPPLEHAPRRRLNASERPRKREHSADRSTPPSRQASRNSGHHGKHRRRQRSSSRRHHRHCDHSYDSATSSSDDTSPNNCLENLPAPPVSGDSVNGGLQVARATGSRQGRTRGNSRCRTSHASPARGVDTVFVNIGDGAAGRPDGVGPRHVRGADGGRRSRQRSRDSRGGFSIGDDSDRDHDRRHRSRDRSRRRDRDRQSHATSRRNPNNIGSKTSNTVHKPQV